MDSITDEAYFRAIDAVKKCINKNGLYASGGISGYNSIWSRDSMITLLGASLVKDKEIKEAYKKSLNYLAKFQNDLGEIPNCIDIFDKVRPKQVTFATIDSSLWFIIGEYVYALNYKDKSLLNKHKKNIEKAFLWLRYQDAGNDGMPEQQPTSDWQDAFTHKYGHVLNTQALYYAALKLAGKKKDADKVKMLINQTDKTGRIDLAFFDKQLGYYLPWIWKDHNGDREHEEWFDSLGNLLTLVFGATDHEKANSVLRYIEKENVAYPYPIRAIDPPIYPRDLEWKSYFSKCISKPYEYLNGGVWPFIGGFYIAALVKLKRYNEAMKELRKLAVACKEGKEEEWEFNEWLHGETGRPMGGSYQAWSAGMYIYAYECVKRKELPIFENFKLG